MEQSSQAQDTSCLSWDRAFLQKSSRVVMSGGDGLFLDVPSSHSLLLKQLNRDGEVLVASSYPENGFLRSSLQSLVSPGAQLVGGQQEKGDVQDRSSSLQWMIDLDAEDEGDVNRMTSS